MTAVALFLLCNLLSYTHGGTTAFASGAMEIHRLYQFLERNILEEGILRCMLMGFPCVPCFSMKHVADGRWGSFLLHRICLCGNFLFDCRVTFHLQVQ